MNIPTESQNENIEMAKAILNELGICDLSFVGYSDANGVSVYFRTDAGLKCRVSNHGTTNRDRMNEELQVSFDERQLGMGGKVSFKSNMPINKLMVKRFDY